MKRIVFCTVGSLGDLHPYVAIAEELQALGSSVVAQTLPANVKAFDYLPYSEVFPKAAAIVHQGGIGTLARALAAGRPQLIVPVAFDQPDNARRAVDLGVARSIPIRKLTARKLAGELAALLVDPACAANAGHAVNGLDGGERRAADALLGCSAPGQPML